MKVIVTGFMGSGKSTISALIARELAFELIEMDDEILKRAGYRSISELFDAEGEAAFRRYESEVAESHQDDSNVVISTGGGTPAQEKAMSALVSGRSVVIYLSVPFNESIARAGERQNRPLLKDLDKAKALYDSRIATYQRWSDITLDAGQPAEVVADLAIVGIREAMNR